MQVSYTTTIDDYVVFCRHCARKSATLWALFLFCWIGIPTMVFAAAAGLFMAGHGWLHVISLTVVGIFAALVFPPVYRVFYDSTIRAYAREKGMRGMIGPITLILSEDRLIEITETTTRSEIRWEDMKGLEVSGDYTFIFVTGLSAAIVPRHGFDSDNEYEAVRDFAIARLRNQTDPQR